MLNPDFRDILSALTDAKADYLLVGAYALAYHGIPRATGDIDLWIRPSPENADRVLNALRRFGAPMEQFTREELGREDWVFQIGVVPRRIDLLTSLSGLTFAESWSKRKQITLDGVETQVIDKASLIRNKRAAGRPKDLADAIALERLPENS
jgi:hypothetical protein